MRRKLCPALFAALLAAGCGGKEEPVAEAPAPPPAEAPAPEAAAPKFTPPPQMPVFTPPPAMPNFSQGAGAVPGGSASGGQALTGYTPRPAALKPGPAALPKSTPPPALPPMPPVSGGNVKMPEMTRTVNPDGTVTMSIQPPK